MGNNNPNLTTLPWIGVFRRHPSEHAPFKGNVDLEALAAMIATHGADNIGAVIVTVPNPARRDVLKGTGDDFLKWFKKSQKFC